MGFMIGGQVGDTLGWRWALRVTPALLALLTATAVPFVQEPARGASDGVGGAVASGEGGAGLSGWARDVAAVLRTPSVALSILGAAACNFAIGAITVWIAMGDKVIKCRSPLNVLKYTSDHSCY